MFSRLINKKLVFILLVLEIHRFKSVKACRPKARQAKVNANSSTNSLEVHFIGITCFIVLIA
ncbi:MAG: hypothetical protein LBP59_15885 [Planctomycetaceae bacterium]|nr:hypothetical protein [Planctomycetaceae bacterium]